MSEIKYCPICKGELESVGFVGYRCQHCGIGLIISIDYNIESPLLQRGGELENNHKGLPCIYNDKVFCQEGYCSDCSICLKMMK